MLNTPKYICGEKEYLYDKCKGCVNAFFKVAQGLHPDYGWWIQCCKLDKCKPFYNTFSQLEIEFL